MKRMALLKDINIISRKIASTIRITQRSVQEQMSSLLTLTKSFKEEFVISKNRKGGNVSKLIPYGQHCMTTKPDKNTIATKVMNHRCKNT